MGIKRLPTELVNQIAAGEVVERPANVVKELVENALDAGAGRIDVVSEGGGRDLLSVRDDGRGITPEELPLALAPHATSKITSLEDLESVATMGFRGEALASIASVSRLTLRSRVRGSEEAWVIGSEDGGTLEPEPTSGPEGTLVEIRSLFHNTPARRKFLKTDATEHARISELLQTIAMAHPACGFSLRFGKRTVLELAATDDPRRRVVEVLGRELTDELLTVDFEGGGITIWGLAGTPSIAGPTSKRQRIYVNGRPIQDRAIQHALREAYRGLVEPGRHPTVVLFLEIDPRLVDVNVHPTKTEIRFRDSGTVHQAVRRALKATLSEHDLVPSIELGGGGGGPARDWGAGNLRAAGSGGGAPTFPAAGAGGGTPSYGSLRQGLEEPISPVDFLAPIEPAPTGEENATPELMPRISNDIRILQVHAKYLFIEDAEGVLVIDQHALHERMMFEQLKARIESGPLEVQQFLVPDMIEVDAASIEALEQLGPLLDRLGFDAGVIGPRTIAIRGMPSFLLSRNVEAGPFLREVLAFGAEQGVVDEIEPLLAEVLDMMACKAAIKAGDRLSDHELVELIARREEIERASNCPHGRPTSLRITIPELDRKFGRSS